MRNSLMVLCAALALVLTVWLMQPEDPTRRNAITTEGTPLELAILPIEAGVTLARVHQGTDLDPNVVLVTGVDASGIFGIDLTAGEWTASTEFFTVFQQVGADALADLAAQAHAGDLPVARYGYEDLLPAAGTATRHVASGTNFPEHQEETNAQGVFNFPKFGAPTPPVTTVAQTSDELLDFEVEICARFDRDIANLADFDAAQMGFFLCGDFTDRAVLTRLVDPDNLDSGTGFSDAKSGPDHFPSGGLFVIPNDWQAFVADERLMTRVNGELRQDTRARDMILSFRELAENALSDAVKKRFLFEGAMEYLVEDRKIAQGQVLMSGTAEGVIFIPPNMRQIIRGALRYFTEGHLFGGTSPYDAVVASFVREEQASGRYLQAGDEVIHLSSTMGMISAQVVRSPR